MGNWQLLWVSVFTPSSLCRSLGKVTGLAALLPVASHCWNLRLEPVILSRLSCLVEDKLQDLPQSTLGKKCIQRGFRFEARFPGRYGHHLTHGFISGGFKHTPGLLNRAHGPHIGHDGQVNAPSQRVHEGP